MPDLPPPLTCGERFAALEMSWYAVCQDESILLANPDFVFHCVATGQVEPSRLGVPPFAGQDPNEGCPSSLTLAAQFAPERIALLVAHGANPDALDERCRTPASYAAEFGPLRALVRLTEAGADLALPDRLREDGRCATILTTPLHRAVARGAPDLVGWLLEHGADPDAFDRWGQTPLMRMSYVGSPVIARALLAAGADVDLEVPAASHAYAHEVGRTALHLALARGNNDELISLLLVAGADPRHVDASGRSAVKDADYRSRPILCRHGVDAACRPLEIAPPCGVDDEPTAGVEVSAAFGAMGGPDGPYGRGAAALWFSCFDPWGAASDEMKGGTWLSLGPSLSWHDDVRTAEAEVGGSIVILGFGAELYARGGRAWTSAVEGWTGGGGLRLFLQPIYARWAAVGLYGELGVDVESLDSTLARAVGGVGVSYGPGVRLRSR